MEDIVRNGLAPAVTAAANLKARRLCDDLVDFATRLTSAKRHLLEDVDLYVDQDGQPLDKEEQKIRRRKICERLAMIPGKLDHATVVGYQVGLHSHMLTNTRDDASLAANIANPEFMESVI